MPPAQGRANVRQPLKEIRFGLAKTRLRAPLVWARSRNFTPADVFIASYPRAGSTWFNFLMYQLLTGRTAEFGEESKLIPYVGAHAPAARLLPGQGRLIKTHELYRGEYKQAIYIARDVRDVVISEYHYLTWLGVLSCEFEAFVEQFVRGKANQFGSWTDHVNSWLDAAGAGKVRLFLVKYETLREQTAPTLAGIADFLGLGVDSTTIQRTIEDNSIERMREREDRARDGLLKPARDDLRFVRQGTTGGWRKLLAPGQVQAIEEYAGTAMARLGYPLERV